MMNQFVIVGRLVEQPELVEVGEEGYKGKIANIKLSVTRAYKNEEGIYETDIIPFELRGAVAENTAEWCNKGDLVGLRGRVEMYEGNIKIIVDRVTFLTTKREDM